MNTLKQSRQRLGLTQEKMAQAMGISIRTYCRHESNGGSIPLRKLAEMLASPPNRSTQDG